MASPSRHRVLADISWGASGFTGIPIETRLLFDGLSTCVNVDLTGLIYAVLDGVPQLTGDPADRLDVRVERQAGYLYHYLSRAAKSDSATAPPPFVVKLLRRISARLSKFWRRTTNRTVKTELMLPKFFRETLWDNWLGKSLPESVRHIAHLPILLTELTNQSLAAQTMSDQLVLTLDTNGYDFVLLHTARRLPVAATTCKVIRHYDLIQVQRPEFLTTSANPIALVSRGVRACQDDSIFACISEAARDDLLAIYPDLAEQTVTIPCTLADSYFPEQSSETLAGILARHTCAETQTGPGFPGEVPPYLLTVCTLEPRKNHRNILRAYEKLLATTPTDLRLVFVGSLGSEAESIVTSMAPLMQQGRLVHLHQVPQDELRVLYSHARAVVFPSLIEGFGYSPLEAMSCGTPVIASDIPVHRGVYGDAAEYCDPYRPDTLAAAIQRVCLDANESLRADLIERGFLRVKRYKKHAVAAMWQALFDELSRQKITHNVKDARLADFNQELRRIEAAREVWPDERRVA